MVSKAKDNKRAALGEDPGTAQSRLKKMVLFSLLVKLGLSDCFRCGLPMTVETCSLDHMEPWLQAENPVVAFYDLDNVTFSHLRCNVDVANKTVRAKHGTLTMYRLYKCRCVLCRAARSKAHFEWKDRHKVT